MHRSLRVGLALIGAFTLVVGGTMAAQGALPLRTKVCGQIVRNSFRLANDLVCAGDGLRVGRAGVIIDLNGNTVLGDGGTEGFGIDNSAGHDEVVIRNGRVEGFDDGVKIGADAIKNEVRKVLAVGNTFDGIDIDGGRRHDLIRNRASDNGENGIELTGRHSLVFRNRGHGNTLDGILVEGNGNEVSNNDTRENSANGISVDGNRNTVRRNFACGNLVNLVVLGTDNDVGNNDQELVCPS